MEYGSSITTELDFEELQPVADEAAKRLDAALQTVAGP